MFLLSKLQIAMGQVPYFKIETLAIISDALYTDKRQKRLFGL